ncbi:hypothetical protein [Bacillus sp. J37]|nr:hypothetical protein [Bacillus sp. J37]
MRTYDDLVKELKEDNISPDEANKMIRGYQILLTVITNLEKLSEDK